MHRPEFAASQVFDVSSPVLTDGQPVPVPYTADGAGLSPPIAWHAAPVETQSVVLLIEDADSPSLLPLVHGIAWLIGRPNGAIPENALRADAERALPTLGRNSFLRAGYLPMDPPPGHGPHRYFFQFFALGTLLQLSGAPGRQAVLRAMRGNVLAIGNLQVTYER